MTSNVSVIVPHFRDLPGLDRCLEALGRQTLPRERFEIVVADNNSPEGEAAVAAAIAGRARLTIVRERGAGPARNGGVAASAGSILAFTDSDCVPEPEWLEQGVLALARADFVGGAMRVLVDDEANLTSAEAFERVFAFDNEDYVRRKGFSVTANLFCPRSLFEDVGGFRVGVSEDLEWCRRASSKGYRLGYAPAAVVGHPARRTWSELERKWRRLDEEAFNLAVAERRGRMRWLIKGLAMPASAFFHTPKVLTSRALATHRDRLKALGMLYRVRFWRGIDFLRVMSEAR